MQLPKNANLVYQHCRQNYFKVFFQPNYIVSWEKLERLAESEYLELRSLSSVWAFII